MTILVIALYSDPNTRYIKKAVRIMGKYGIYVQRPEWGKVVYGQKLG